MTQPAFVSSPAIVTTTKLEAGGFNHAGIWCHDDASGSIRLKGKAAIPREAGVYAYGVDGIVHYVGAAQRGLHRRFRHYEITKTLPTTLRVRSEILTLLAADRVVDVFTIVPPPMTLNGLPVDAIAGLEAGLIRALQPRWNRLGKGASG